MSQSKGQKIVAALYLVTQHLSDTDPLKLRIRAHAVDFVGSKTSRSVIGRELGDLLIAAEIAGLMSKQNVTILISEINLHATHDAHHGAIESLFPADEHLVVKRYQSSNMSFMSDKLSIGHSKNTKNIENKSKRQQQILSLINERKSVAIKDISSLFPDVSEKTIQRELGSLVAEGKITKRGSKRWSIYMAL